MSFQNDTQHSVRQQAVQWLVERHSGKWDGENELRLNAWLAEDATHQQAFEQARLTWDDLGEAVAGDPARIAAARRFRAPAQRSRLQQWIAPGIAFAAGCAVFAVLVAVPWWNGTPQTYVTARGQQRTVTLNDGSSIALNADSELITRIGYGQRQVQLKHGEALFTVVHNESRPFTVHTGAGDIRDIRTVFNVESRNEQVLVSVLGGEVAVTTHRYTDKVMNLLAGQGVAFDATGILSPVARVDADEVIAWRELKLVFHDQPLGVALARLAPYHDVEFEIADPGLNAVRISGSFHIGDLNLFLKTLETAFPLRAKVLDSHHVRLQGRAT